MSASPFEAELDTALVDSVQTVPVGDVADNDAGALRVGTPLSAVEKWGLDTPNTNLRSPGSVFSTPGVQIIDAKELRELVLVAMDQLLESFAGPLQFLAARYDTDESKQEFAQQLWKMFPKDDAVDGHYMNVIPVSAEEEMDKAPSTYFHVGMFNFDITHVKQTQPSMKMPSDLLMRY